MYYYVVWKEENENAIGTRGGRPGAIYAFCIEFAGG
jgi:hypothetical protein